MSSKKFRTTYILIAIFAVLFLFVYFYEKDRLVKDPEEIETYQIIQIEESEIKQIKFSYDNKETIVKKDGEDWKIIKPIKYKARQQKISDIITEVNNAESEQKFESDNLAEYGLDNPTTEIIFTKNSDEEISLIIGNLNPQQTKAYIKTSLNNKIYLVDSMFESRLRVDDEILKED